MEDRRSRTAFAAAERIFPGGVNSPVRSFRAVGGTPRVMADARGARLVDVDGNEFVDLVAGWGSALLGHAAEPVRAAIREQCGRGWSTGTPTELEARLGAEIIARVAPVEMVRLVNSGTEATMSAIRLARGATGRTGVVKFSGHYHGHVDALLVEAGSGALDSSAAVGCGVTKGQAEDTFVLPYNDFDAVERLFAHRGEGIACVIAEPAAGNMGTVPPDDGFNSLLREVTEQWGSLLIWDEVMTGFRVARDGYHGLDPVPADLYTFGKVMAGGCPAAAFGGRADVMAELAPVGPVYQAGTMSGNSLAACAGLATLQAADEGVYGTLDRRAGQICGALEDALAALGAPWQVQSAGNLFSLFFTEEPVNGLTTARRAEHWRYPSFFHAMLEAGVYLPPSPFESWFVSAALTDDDVDTITQAFTPALRAASEARSAAAVA